jgi:hypothetical protein
LKLAIWVIGRRRVGCKGGRMHPRVVLEFILRALQPRQSNKERGWRWREKKRGRDEFPKLVKSGAAALVGSGAFSDTRSTGELLSSSQGLGMFPNTGGPPIHFWGRRGLRVKGRPHKLCLNSSHRGNVFGHSRKTSGSSALPKAQHQKWPPGISLGRAGSHHHHPFQAIGFPSLSYPLARGENLLTRLM